MKQLTGMPNRLDDLRQSKAMTESLVEFNALKHQDSFDTLRLKEASVASELEFERENATLDKDSEQMKTSHNPAGF